MRTKFSCCSCCLVKLWHCRVISMIDLSPDTVRIGSLKPGKWGYSLQVEQNSQTDVNQHSLASNAYFSNSRCKTKEVEPTLSCNNSKLVVRRDLEGISKVQRAIICPSFSNPYSSSKDFRPKPPTADVTRIITCGKFLFTPIFGSNDLCNGRSILSFRGSVRAGVIQQIDGHQ